MHSSSPLAVVQEQLDAYNARDIERLLEEVSFSAGDLASSHDDKVILIDAEYVNSHLGELAQNEDLSRYIL